MSIAAPAAPKARKRPTKAEIAEETKGLVEAIPEWVASIASPLLGLLVAGPRATEAKDSYNKSLLKVIVKGLRATTLVPAMIADIYAGMKTDTAPKVGVLARKNASEEQAAKFRDSAAKKMADASGPFWRISAIIEIDGVESILAEATKEKASLGKLNTWTKNRIDALAFDPLRGSTLCHYMLGDGVDVEFKVSEATNTLNVWTDAQEVADTLKEDNSKEWGAVRRQFRVEHPANMPDGRTNKEQNSDIESARRAKARSDRAIVGLLETTMDAKDLEDLKTKALTEV